MSNDVWTAAYEYREEFEHPDPVAIQAFGFWLFLMSDLLLFSALFATFGVLNRSYAGGPTGKQLFDLYYTFGETMFLLLSTAFCGLAMLAVRKGAKKLTLLGFSITFLLGLGFVAMEIHEFYGMVAKGHGPQVSAFISIFFTLVGTHGTHVTFGLVWMVVMLGQVMVKGLTTPVQSRLLRLSMYWHFLDIIWIGIFTYVYLLGAM